MERSGTLVRYLAAVVITVLAVLSQYFLPQDIPGLLPIYSSVVGDLAVVYGIPVVACAVLIGFEPVRQWRSRNGTAAVEGLRWYGLLTLVGLVVAVVLTILYERLDPSALNFLTRPNPALTQAAGDPWFYVGLSFVAGAFEEAIFRGWIFGFWRGRARGWWGPAIGSSALFAGVHLYYGITYGPASPLVYPTLFLLGFAFAQTYRLSGGNLVVVALLHGVNDATVYLTLIIGVVGTELHYAVVFLGVLVAIVLYLRAGPSEGRTTPPSPTEVWPYAEGLRISSTQIPSGPS
jgi:membrane protease YdiL (CAAX protease family)